jgi:large subunit ribosomal protein L18
MLSKGKEKRSRRNRYRLKKANKSGLRPSVFKSSKHLYAQVIDDDKGVTLCSASTVKMPKNKNSCNIANAKLIGEQIGKVAVDKGISKLYLDRGPNIYHGIVKTIADTVRSAGLKF